ARSTPPAACSPTESSPSRPRASTSWSTPTASCACSIPDALVCSAGAPDLVFAEAQCDQVVAPQRRVGGEQKLVQLRRRNAGAGEQGVCLPGRVDRVHEEGGETAIGGLFEHRLSVADE